MGAHEYLDVTRGEVFQDVFTLLALHDTCEEFHTDVYIFQEVTEGLEVLLGENFRRSHQAGLETIVEGDEHGHQCHEGLARTDITLQEAVHLATAAHVGTYLVHHSLLCPRQLEGVNQFSSPALFQNDDFSLVLFFHVLAKLSVTLQIFIDLLGGFKGKTYFCKRISRIEESVMGFPCT